MRQVMVRYTVRPDEAERNERLVQDVYRELDATAPEGLRYATFVLDGAEDGVSFVHMATIDTPDGENPLSNLPAFAAFTQDIAARCVAPPVTVNARTVGAYRLYGEPVGSA